MLDRLLWQHLVRCSKLPAALWTGLVTVPRYDSYPKTAALYQFDAVNTFCSNKIHVYINFCINKIHVCHFSTVASYLFNWYCNLGKTQVVNYLTCSLWQVIACENEPVRWTTPLGLPVVQPYRKLGRHLVSVISIYFIVANLQYASDMM